MDTKMTSQHIAEVLVYQRTAVKVLATDTIKGRALEAAALHELDLTTYAFAGKLAETNRQFNRDRFLTAAGVNV